MPIMIKRSFVTAVQYFCTGVDHANLVSLVPNIYQKLD